MHHSVNEFAKARWALFQLESRYKSVSRVVQAIMTTVTHSSSTSDRVISLSSCSLGLLLLFFSVATICGTSTALKIPPDRMEYSICGIVEPAW